jgi:hypothetical protein
VSPYRSQAQGEKFKRCRVAADAGIVRPPVHDASVVSQKHRAWANQAMVNSRTDAVVRDAKQRVKADFARGRRSCHLAS